MNGLGFTLEVEQEPIRIDTWAPERDPDWRQIDKAGHLHALVDGEYPTLKWVVDRTYWCADCGEDHEEGHHECGVCGEPIEPGTRPSQPRTVPGPRTTKINGVPVPEEEITKAMLDLVEQYG